MSAPDPETRLLNISDFPQHLHDEIADRLALSTVGFSILNNADLTQSRPSGSGILVVIDGRHAVLTADHVAEDLESADRINVLVDWRGEARRCQYQRDHLDIRSLARGADDGNGPDLAVIFLPEGGEASATLRTQKVFYDLDRRIATLPDNYVGLEWGFWFACGVPAEGSVVGSSRVDLQACKLEYSIVSPK